MGLLASTVIPKTVVSVRAVGSPSRVISSLTIRVESLGWKVIVPAASCWL